SNNPGQTGTATATDNCTSIVTNISYTDSRTNGSCKDNYIIARTWTAIDSCNNSRTCIQNISVQDTTRPSIICPVDVTVNCDASKDPTSTGTAIASDNCTD